MCVFVVLDSILSTFKIAVTSAAAHSCFQQYTLGVHACGSTSAFPLLNLLPLVQGFNSVNAGAMITPSFGL
jgi:hypothetical protein